MVTDKGESKTTNKKDACFSSNSNVKWENINNQFHHRHTAWSGTCLALHSSVLNRGTLIDLAVTGIGLFLAESQQSLKIRLCAARCAPLSEMHLGIATIQAFIVVYWFASVKHSVMLCRSSCCCSPIFSYNRDMIGSTLYALFETQILNTAASI